MSELYDREKVEQLLGDLPGSAEDIPADVFESQHLRHLVALSIHQNYLLAAVLVELRKLTDCNITRQ